MEYAELRKRMVEDQLIARGIKDKFVLDAFYKIERHNFIPEALRQSAYADHPVPIGEGQTISQPYIVALMTEALGLSGREKVLEIGTGSGYQAAILAELAKEVYTIERHGALAERTEALIKELGYKNIKIRTGDGTLGWKEEAPFDRIIVTAAAPEIPQPLADQLKDGGKLIMPLGGAFGQILTLAEKINNKLKLLELCGCTFVPLIGQYSQNR
ncbi:MAG: protein-L-isoaspartate(D-aspartate) O-methyltransferase [Candidatus Omnitrophica bacterium]|nr:protein-L-isoaspartate(D-aspartate) O-methyltransferase [Candidatus Omnitrophota bacterium]